MKRTIYYMILCLLMSLGEIMATEPPLLSLLMHKVFPGR